MKTVVLTISGMHCERCISDVTRNLECTRGVREIDVDLLSRSARVAFDAQRCRMDDLNEAVRRAGFQVDAFTFPGAGA